MNKCQHIGMIMCNATESILWGKTKDWVFGKNKAITFRSRLGTGLKTYCRSYRNIKFEIVYGSKMINSKFDFAQAQCWTTGKEILERGYFNGTLQLPELLSHTVCHEFAHLVQFVKGWVYDNNVHNKYFYTILSRIHESGIANTLLEYINVEAKNAGILLEYDFNDDKKMEKFKTGDQVWFYVDNRRVEGEVKEVIAEKLKIKPFDRWNEKGVWTVYKEQVQLLRF